jgi:hypothetical protein
VWVLIEIDRTLALWHPVNSSSVSGRMVNNVNYGDRTLRRVRSILIGASGHSSAWTSTFKWLLQLNEWDSSETCGVHWEGTHARLDAMTASCHNDQRVRSVRRQQQLVPTALFFGATYKYVFGQFGGALSWTFWLSNILLSWAYPLPLISLAWLTNQSEFEWSQVHLLVSLHLVALGWALAAGFLLLLVITAT